MPDRPLNQKASSPRAPQPAPATAGVAAPPPLVYALPLILGLLLQRWHPIRLLDPTVATTVGIVGVLLGLVGLPAILAFRRANTSPMPFVPSTALVTSGPYRFTRNPMYLGFTLIYLGVTFWANAGWPLLFLPLVLVIMHFGVILREEAYLARTFGQEYEKYRGRVRRWL